jgi:hypothetical protein
MSITAGVTVDVFFIGGSSGVGLVPPAGEEACSDRRQLDATDGRATRGLCANFLGTTAWRGWRVRAVIHTQTVEQSSWFRGERPCETEKVHQGDVAFAPLERADVGPVESAHLGQRFLRHTELEAPEADAVAEHPECEGAVWHHPRRTELTL